MNYKTVLKAKDYEISVNGDIRRKDGKECTFTTVNDEPCITLVIYGGERTVTIEWLRLITHFEVDLKAKDFFNVYFVPTKVWYKGNSVNQTMLFDGRRPEYKPGFRIIPCFTRYAISFDGIVIDTTTDTEIKYTCKENTYPAVNIYNPDKSIFSHVLVHRLVALAWVKNPNHLLYYLVNHKDGNKQNPIASNLEWTDHTGNIDHAYSSGLRNQNTYCKIRNVETNEIITFASIRRACEIMEVAPKSYAEFVRFNSVKLINGKYQIKLQNDNTPWDENYTIKNKTKVKIIITDETDKKHILYSITDLGKYFNLSCAICNVRYHVSRLIKDSNITVEYIETINKTAIQVYDTQTNTITEYESINDINRKLNISKSTISNNLNKGETFLTNGYAYRYKTNKPWNTQFTEAINRPKCILAINKDGREITCNSLREAELLTKVNRRSIRKALHGVILPINWKFSYLY